MTIMATDEANTLQGSDQIIAPKKYKSYVLKTDPSDDDKATEIRLCSIARPHMRAFHCAWWSSFNSFFIWFAIAPLLSEIRISLNLTQQEIWTSSIWSVGGSIIPRLVSGSLCDKYGARILTGIVLMAASIPTAMIGLVNSAAALSAVRFFTGIAGSTFVMSQFWTSRMFTKEVAGTANALVNGWGCLGAGAIQVLVGSVLFPLFKQAGLTSEQAWRRVLVVPAAITFASAAVVMIKSDDSPKGNYSKMKKNKTMSSISATQSFHSGASKMGTWILFLQYACCSGVEITMNNAAALHFIDKFDQSPESAGAMASVFGFMSFFSSGLGGFISDKANAQKGMKGRIWWQTFTLLLESVMIVLFAYTESAKGAIAILAFLSIVVYVSEGSTFGIVPYIDPAVNGAISGIVGAGGPVGALCFGFLFRQLDYNVAFMAMGGTVAISSVLSLLISVEGHSGLFGASSSLKEGNEQEKPKGCKEGSAVAISTKASNVVESTDKDAEPLAKLSYSETTARSSTTRIFPESGSKNDHRDGFEGNSHKGSAPAASTSVTISCVTIEKEVGKRKRSNDIDIENHNGRLRVVSSEPSTTGDIESGINNSDLCTMSPTNKRHALVPSSTHEEIACGKGELADSNKVSHETIRSKSALSA